MCWRWDQGEHDPSQWRHNEGGGVTNHRRLDCLLNRLFRCRSKKASKLRATGLYEGNSPVTGEFPAQMASNAENVSIWWRHQMTIPCYSRGTMSVLGTSSVVHAVFVEKSPAGVGVDNTDRL